VRRPAQLKKSLSRSSKSVSASFHGLWRQPLIRIPRWWLTYRTRSHGRFEAVFQKWARPAVGSPSPQKANSCCPWSVGPAWTQPKTRLRRRGIAPRAWARPLRIHYTGSSNNEGHMVAVTLDTKGPHQRLLKTLKFKLALESRAVFWFREFRNHCTEVCVGEKAIENYISGESLGFRTFSHIRASNAALTDHKVTTSGFTPENRDVSTTPTEGSGHALAVDILFSDPPANGCRPLRPRFCDFKTVGAVGEASALLAPEVRRSSRRPSSQDSVVYR